jgi:hypothetical protein
MHRNSPSLYWFPVGHPPFMCRVAEPRFLRTSVSSHCRGQLEVLELDSIPHSQVSIPMHGTGEMFGGFQFAFHKRLVDDAFAVTSVSSLRCHASTCFRMGSKLRSIRSTPTAMQSIRENDFECLAKTGVNARDNVSSSGLWCSIEARSNRMRLNPYRGVCRPVP